jgi:hypothetical protein
MAAVPIGPSMDFTPQYSNNNNNKKKKQHSSTFFLDEFINLFLHFFSKQAKVLNPYTAV